MSTTHDVFHNASVGIVLPYLRRRGTELQSLQLALGFRDAGLPVVILVVQGWGETDVYEEFARCGVRVVNVEPAASQNEKTVDTERFRRLSEVATGEGCSVLLSRSGLTNGITVRAAAQSGIPSLTVLSSSVYDRAGSLKRHVSRFVRHVVAFLREPQPSRVISVSNENARFFARRYPLLRRRVRAIPNGLDIDRADTLRKAPPPEMDVPEAALTVSFCGSLELHRKGLDTLISAFDSLQSATDRPLRLLLVGDGSDREEAKQMVARLGIAQQVVFCGNLDNPFPVLAKSDVFVLPSRKEGMPNALLEAMACGRCCIAADCNTGPREIIAHERDGFLFEPGDSNGLCVLLERVSGDSSLRERVGNAARETVLRTFSSGRMIAEYVRVLREVMY